MIFREIAYRSEEWVDAVRLRERILREPLGSKFSEEELNEERNHIHIAGFTEMELIATAVLVPEGDYMKMQRVAVLETYRNKKVGAGILEFCESMARSNGARTMYCHARDSAVKFYAQNNYKEDGA